MKKLPHFLTFCVLLLCSMNAMGQGEIPVDMYTGTPSIEVAVATITSHDLSDRISLVYNAKGLKISESSGKFGAGWSLNTGGSIRREVRGLPDDYTGTTSNDQRRGWLYLMGATGVNAAAANLPNSADNSPSTCSDETSDFNTLYQYRGSSLIYDSEPDIFHVEIPGGISGTFVFDNSPTPQIRLIPYQDLKIEPVFVSGSKKIEKFIITTNTGVVYQFYETTTESRKTTSITDEINIEFLKSEFQLYNTAGGLLTDATYNSNWHLTKIKSPSGDSLQYFYTSEAFDETDTVRVSVRKGFLINDYVMDNVFTDRRYGTKKSLSSIVSAAGPRAVLETGGGGMVIAIHISDIRRGPGAELVKTVKLTYDGVFSRLFLMSVKDTVAGFTHPPYKFDYGNIYSLPTQYSKSQDFWGYYNGRANTTLAPRIYVYPQLAPEQRYRLNAIPGYSGENYVLEGADRTANPAAIDAGTLKAITYPWGGRTTIIYECNTYRDEYTSQDLNGGGLRIKSFTYMDGLNPSAKITKTFTYTDDTGNSSGRIVHEPVFVFPAWEYRDPLTTSEASYSLLSEDAATLWSALTVRSEQDISYGDLTHGSNVGYMQVKVYRPGSGYAHFEFTMPAAKGASAIGDWTPTNNTFARLSTTCPSMNVISAGSRNIFPYAPDPNYDYERGLVWRKREYDAQNVLVRKTETAYQYLYKSGTTPAKVWGFKFEKYPNSDEDIWLFGKYFLLTDVAKVTASETVTIYDAADASKLNVDLTQYFYESASHKLLSRIAQTRPDGTVYTTRLKYPLDYGTIPSGADAPSQMIGTLQSSFRNGVPIETYTTINRNATGEKVINGSIVLLNSFGTKILPEHQLSWNQASALAHGSFTPSFIHAFTKTFKFDPGYEKTTTFLAYDNFGKPKSVTSPGRNVVNMIWGYDTSVPVATLTDASLNQAAFSDFESSGSPLAFGLASNIPDDPNFYYGAGHTGSKGISPSIKLTATLNKGASSYRFSGWWNKGYTSLQVQVKIKTTSNPGTVYFDQTYTINSVESAFEWEYFEKEIPIDASLVDFIVEINFGAFTGSLRVDDIGFVPVHATLSTFTYQFPFGASSSLSTSKGSISEFDPLGRLKYVMDAHRNIIQRTKHEFTNNN